MTDGKTTRMPRSLEDRALERVHGGTSIEFEGIIISSLKDDRKPREDGFKPPLDSGKGS